MLVAPSTSAVGLDTLDRTISIPPRKLSEIKKIFARIGYLRMWYPRMSIAFGFPPICNEMKWKSDQFFLNRMLQLYRNNVTSSWIWLDPELLRDLNWYVVFLEQYNVIIFMTIGPLIIPYIWMPHWQTWLASIIWCMPHLYLLILEIIILFTWRSSTWLWPLRSGVIIGLTSILPYGVITCQ